MDASFGTALIAVGGVALAVNALVLANALRAEFRYRRAVRRRLRELRQWKP